VVFSGCPFPYLIGLIVAYKRFYKTVKTLGVGGYPTIILGIEAGFLLLVLSLAAGLFIGSLFFHGMW
jgi:hypothetical protein